MNSLLCLTELDAGELNKLRIMTFHRPPVRKLSAQNLSILTKLSAYIAEFANLIFLKEIDCMQQTWTSIRSSWNKIQQML